MRLCDLFVDTATKSAMGISLLESFSAEGFVGKCGKSIVRLNEHPMGSITLSEGSILIGARPSTGAADLIGASPSASRTFAMCADFSVRQLSDRKPL